MGEKPLAWCQKCGRPLVAKVEVTARECSDPDACLTYKIQGSQGDFAVGVAARP